MRSSFLFPVLLAMLAPPLWSAAPVASPVTVIHDGRGVPLAPYLEQFIKATGEEGREPAAARSAAHPHPPQLFPVISTNAGPGRLLQNPMPSKLPGGPGQPIFIIGDDGLSHEWLQRNAQALERMGARGIVAAVRTQEDFMHLRAMVDLQLVPMPAGALLEAAGVHVWPVLISPDGSILQ